MAMKLFRDGPFPLATSSAGFSGAPNKCAGLAAVQFWIKKVFPSYIFERIDPK
jgi:hypothetical protein